MHRSAEPLFFLTKSVGLPSPAARCSASPLLIHLHRFIRLLPDDCSQPEPTATASTLPPLRSGESGRMPISLRSRHLFRSRQTFGEATSKESPNHQSWHRRKKVGGVPAKTSASCPVHRKHSHRH